MGTTRSKRVSVTFETTPNPNAIKCISSKPIFEGIRSYRRAEDADCELSRAVFAIDGVTSLLINGSWMTVNKAPEASWPPIKRRVSEILDSQ